MSSQEVRGRSTAIAVVMLCAIIGIQPSWADNGFELSATFVPDDSEPGDLFGKLVDLDGTTAIVRSRDDYNLAERERQTHVFRSAGGAGWLEADVILHPADSNLFRGETGSAIDDGVIINGQSTGTRSVSRLSPLRDVTFTNVATLPAAAQVPDVVDNNLKRPSNRDSPFFIPRSPRTTGHDVDISGGIAIAGDSGFGSTDSENRDIVGAAHIYERSDDGEWFWSTAITPDAEIVPDPLDRFFSYGYQVALDGETAMISSHVAESTVSFYQRESFGEWRRTTTFSFEDATSSLLGGGKAFGLAISGDTAVIRSYDVNTTLVLTRSIDDEWEVDAQLPVAPSRKPGRSVAIEGDLLAVASSGVDNTPTWWSTNTPRQSVEVFRRDAAGTWNLIDTLYAPHSMHDMSFGSSVAIDEGRILVGASGEFNFQPSPVPGAAYLFTPVPEPATMMLLMAGMMFVVGASTRGVQRFPTFVALS